MKVLVTGASGLIGWHIACRLYSQNCFAEFENSPKPYEIKLVGHKEFQESVTLAELLKETDVIFHCAGVNRAPDHQIEVANPAIAQHLVQRCREVGISPHIIYTNSTHAQNSTPYGRSKRRAGEILSDFSGRFTNIFLPHIFGEGARAYYNNVTATFIDKLLRGEEIVPDAAGRVELLHAGLAAKIAIDAAIQGTTGNIFPVGHPMSVSELLDTLKQFHFSYINGIYPDLSDEFYLSLFNSYRFATYPNQWPRDLKLHSDNRGVLFEAVKGGGGGQTFISTTFPGVTRGDHFHLSKVERFLVIKGKAKIRMRKVLHDNVLAYTVSGENPAPVDMPTLYTHSIENIGDEPLMTLFWTNAIFDPKHPDTFADKVLS